MTHTPADTAAAADGTDWPLPAEPPDVRVIPPQEDPAPSDMRIGVRVLRFTERAEPGLVRAEMPCCPREEVATDAPLPARGVLLPSNPLTTIAHAGCPACCWLWRFRLIDERADGYLAVFDLIGKVAMAEPSRTYTGAP